MKNILQKIKLNREIKRFEQGESLLKKSLIIIFVLFFSMFLFNVNKVQATVSWYGTAGWGYRTKITIDHTKVPNTNQLYFPVLISRTDTNWKVTGSGGHVGQADGGDFLFTSSDGTTKLPHEIEKYNSTTGELVAWVQVPTLATGTDTDIYLYYGNASVADQWNITGTWNEGGNNYFKGVWHLPDGTTLGDGTYTYDSTSNNNKGTLSGTTKPSATAGQVGGAGSFNGTSSYAVTSASTLVNPGSSPLSISAWVKVASSWDQGEVGYNRRLLMQAIDANNEFMMVQGNGTSGGGAEPDRRIGFVIRSNGTNYEKSMTNAGTSTMAPDTWFNVALTWDPTGTVQHIYINGVDQALTAEGSNYGLGTVDNKFYMGMRSDSHAFFKGSFDELQISSVVRSADWIKTEYNNQSSPATFYLSISEESAGDTTPADVNLTYSANPAKAGAMTVTATYSEPISSTPTISINQPGSTDISNSAMTAPGSAWTTVTNALGGSFTAIAYGNGTFVAVQGSTTTVLTSTNGGTTWTQRTASSNAAWSSIAYGNGVFVAVSNTTAVMTSPDGITWTARTGTVSTGYVAYGNNIFVAVGVSNAVMTSPDGITWTTRTGITGNFYGLGYGNGKFVTFANGTNTGMTSPDGITWTGITLPSSLNLRSVAYGNGMFVAVGILSNTVYSSPDGTTWTARATPSSASNSVTFGGGVFVAIGNSTNLITSPDGITWTTQTAASSNLYWQSVTYGGGVFVAVGSQSTSTNIMISSGAYTYSYTVVAANGSTYIDGTATVSLSATTDLAGNVSNAPTNNTFVIDTVAPTVALTYSANTAKAGAMTITATYSEAPSTSPTISINQPGSTDITNASMGGSGTVRTYSYTVVAANGTTYIDGVALVSLSATTDAAGNATATPTNPSFMIDTVAPTVALTYSANPAGAGPMTITASYSELLSSAPTISINQPGSTDITNASMTNIAPESTWTARTGSSTSTWYSMAYGNSTYVAVACNSTNMVMTSPDGITWTSRTASSSACWVSVAYGNGVFVAIAGNGSSNKVMTSPDGITWTSRTASASASWTSITYGNGLFVAVSGASSNTAISSPDGITWTTRTASSSAYWQSVTYGNGVFVAVDKGSTSSNKVMSSTNGTTWTARTGSATAAWQSVTYGNGIFVAISGGVNNNSNVVMTSPDGINWTSRTASASASWTSITYGNGIFVAVAGNNTNAIMTSPDGITWTAKTPSSSANWYSVTYGNGKFVAVAQDSNKVMTMTYPGVYTYSYTVVAANGTTYVDGTATVSLSATTDSALNSSGAPSNNTFVILTSYNITSSTGANGTISPLGVTPVAIGGSQIYTITANNGFKTDTILVDGVSVVVVPTYTFSNVLATHTIAVTFVTAGKAIVATLTSSVFDTTANSSTVGYNSIMWRGTLGGAGNNEGKVSFQLATSNSATGPWNFYGGNTCGALDYFDTVGPNLPIELKGTTCVANWNNKRYFRYKVKLCSNDCVTQGQNTPTVNSIVVNWSP